MAASLLLFTSVVNSQQQNFPGGGTAYYQTVQQGGAAQTQRPKLNFISGANATVSCADNAGAASTDCTFISSSTGSTAFSALTASANSNAGTFSASGNSWDFTATTFLGLRVGSGATTSKNGDITYDSLNSKWQIWQGAANKNLIAASNLGSSGQPCMSNADGSCTFADPLVSGPDANGAAPTKNPVLTAGWDGTDVRTISTDSSGRPNVNINGTVTVSGSVTANAGTNLNTSALALEAGGNLAAIKSDTDKIPALGQALAAASVPVVLTTIQLSALTPPAAITNFAEETGGNLAAVKVDTDKIPSQGQALAAASVPVVLTAIQVSALTPPAAITNFAEETGGNLAAIKTALTTGPVPVSIAATVTVGQSSGANLHVDCDSGCSSSAGFSDNSSFTVGSTAINPIGGLYDTGADPAISNGNAGRARIDAHSYMFVDCVVGCSGGSTTPADAFANPSTAGLQFDLLAGFNGTTWDRLRSDTNKYLYVDVGNTSLPVSIASMPSTPVTGTFYQTTQPVSEATLDGAISSSVVQENVKQVNGITPLMGNGVSGTGSQRVNIASDNTVLPAVGAGATGSAVPANAAYQGGNGTGNLTGYLNCDNTAIYDASTSGATQLVALSSGKIVYVCGYQFSQSTTTTVSVDLIYGTGTACATSPTKMTPAYPLQAATSTGPIGLVVMTPGFTGLKTAASNALCINTTAAVSVQAIVWYTQF